MGGEEEREIQEIEMMRGREKGMGLERKVKYM